MWKSTSAGKRKEESVRASTWWCVMAKSNCGFVSSGAHGVAGRTEKTGLCGRGVRSQSAATVAGGVRHRSVVVRCSMAGGRGGSGGHESQHYSAAENALYDFLTRRAVNTLMVYLEEFHDGPSKDWLEKFAGFKQRGDTFAKADEYLLAMMRTSTQRGTLTVSHPKGYFKRSFPFTIEPRRLAERILAIREQLALEWQRDLQLIAEENKQLNRIHLELSLNGAGTDLNKVRKRIFESDPFADNDSALCPINYRKLKTMVTHYASYAVLEKLHHADNHSYNWLSTYLKTHPVEDDEAFIRAMWHAPSLKMTNPSTVVQPFDLAGEILSERLSIAKDWTFLLTTTPTANRQLLLECLKESVGGIGQQEIRVVAKRDPVDSDGGLPPTPDGPAQP